MGVRSFVKHTRTITLQIKRHQQQLRTVSVRAFFNFFCSKMHGYHPSLIEYTHTGAIQFILEDTTRYLIKVILKICFTKENIQWRTILSNEKIK